MLEREKPRPGRGFYITAPVPLPGALFPEQYFLAQQDFFKKREYLLERVVGLMDGPTDEIFAHPEELSKSFVKPPQITHLGQSLLAYGFPPNVLRVKEMAAIVKEKMTFAP